MKAQRIEVQGGTFGEGDRHQERDQLDKQRAILREQFAEHDEEALFPNVAGMALGPLRIPMSETIGNFGYANRRRFPKQTVLDKLTAEMIS